MSRLTTNTIKQSSWATFIVSTMLFSMNLTGCDRHQTGFSSQSNQQDSPQSHLQSDPQSKPQPDPKIITPDWAVAATLTAMNRPPIATGDIRAWDTWIDEPQLPSSVIDLGSRYLPNVELVAQLKPDLLIDNFFYDHARGVYGDVPNASVLFSGSNGADGGGDKLATWQNFVTPTLKLGELIHEPQLAKDYVITAKHQIEQAGDTFIKGQPHLKKFAVVQFIDATNFRMYAKNSLFNPTLTMMGLELVQLQSGNEWGFSNQKVADLAQLDTDVCLLIIEPLNPLTDNALKDSLVWQRLGYGQPGSDGRCVSKLSPVWVYGGMASLTRLADAMAIARYVGGPAI